MNRIGVVKLVLVLASIALMIPVLRRESLGLINYLGLAMFGVGVILIVRDALRSRS